MPKGVYTRSIEGEKNRLEAIKRKGAWNKGLKVKVSDGTLKNLREMAKSRIGVKRPEFSKEWRDKIGEASKGRNMDEKNNKWKGEGAKYRAKHYWVEKRLGKAKKCDVCGLDEVPIGKKRYFNWANLDHTYKRKIDDYKQMCVKCHREFDKNNNKKV